MPKVDLENHQNHQNLAKSHQIDSIDQLFPEERRLNKESKKLSSSSSIIGGNWSEHKSIKVRRQNKAFNFDLIEPFTKVQCNDLHNLLFKAKSSLVHLRRIVVIIEIDNT